MRMIKNILLITIMAIAPLSAFAKSKTGLASTLIHEWESEVDRKICPSFRYPSHPPSLVTGEKVFKQNCQSCHVPSASYKAAFRTETPEKQFEFVCGGKGDGVHSFAGKGNGKLGIDEMWDSLIYFRSKCSWLLQRKLSRISRYECYFWW
jgi:hypothetical protein